MYKNLKALRQSLNMSQKEFAASLGIGYTTYNGYETGARDPKSDFWIAVARKYGVTIDYLMGYTDDLRGSSTNPSQDRLLVEEKLKVLASEYNNVPDGDKLIKMLLDMEPHERRAALELLINVLTMLAWDNAPAPQESKDTTPTADGPETAPEGE